MYKYLESGLLINLQLENSYTSTSVINSLSLKYGTLFFLFLFKRRKSLPTPLCLTLCQCAEPVENEMSAEETKWCR